MQVLLADWFEDVVARHRVGPTSLGMAPRACTILNKLLLKLLLLLLLLLKRQGQVDGRHWEAGVRVSSADWSRPALHDSVLVPPR